VDAAHPLHSTASIVMRIGPRTPVGVASTERRLASRIVPLAAAPTGVVGPIRIASLSCLVALALAGCYAPLYAPSPAPSPDGGGDPEVDVDPDVDVGGDGDGDADVVPGGEGEGEGEGEDDVEPDPAPDPPPDEDPEDPAVELTADEQDLFEALNAARRDNGLGPVVIDERLLCAARNHANDVGASGDCGHVGSDGSWPWDRAQACGYPQDDWTVNEIAAGPGFTSGDEAVWGWSQSSGHWAAIVHTEAAAVGVGVRDSCYIALFDCCVAGS
jgi:hypothetical protein